MSVLSRFGVKSSLVFVGTSKNWHPKFYVSRLKNDKSTNIFKEKKEMKKKKWRKRTKRIGKKRKRMRLRRKRRERECHEEWEERERIRMNCRGKENVRRV